MAAISMNVDDQLLAELTCVEPLSCLLHLDHDLLLFEQKIDTRRTASVAGRPFFGPNVSEVKREKTAEEVLDVVFVFDLQRRTAFTAISKLTCDEVESPTDVFE